MNGAAYTAVFVKPADRPNVAGATPAGESATMTSWAVGASVDHGPARHSRGWSCRDPGQCVSNRRIRRGNARRFRVVRASRPSSRRRRRRAVLGRRRTRHGGRRSDRISDSRRSVCASSRLEPESTEYTSPGISLDSASCSGSSVASRWSASSYSPDTASTVVVGVALGAIGLLLASWQSTLSISLMSELRLGWVTVVDVARAVLSALLVLATGAGGREPTAVPGHHDPGRDRRARSQRVRCPPQRSPAARLSHPATGARSSVTPFPMQSRRRRRRSTSSSP